MLILLALEVGCIVALLSPDTAPIGQISRPFARQANRVGHGLPDNPRRPAPGATRRSQEVRCVLPVQITSRPTAKISRGSIVRVGPNTLSFNTLGAVKEIYANRQGNVQKAPWYTVIEASAGGANSLHAETNRQIHASHRRVMEHAFKDRSLRESEAILAENVLAFCEIVSQTDKSNKAWSKPFNMSEWSTYLNYDIMGDLVFGKRFNVMTSDAHRFVPKLIMNSTAFIYTVSSASH